MSLPFGNTVGSKVEENGSTTGTDLLGVLDKNCRQIDGIVEQNCEAGAVEHFRKDQGVGNSFPPDEYSMALIRGDWGK